MKNADRIIIDGKLDQQIADTAASLKNYPYEFVVWAFPWGEKGTFLEDYDGPDEWQTRFLKRLGQRIRAGEAVKWHDVASIRMAVASGNGIGKTALICMLILWFISTREQAPQIKVTASKADQLSGTTWRELAKWKDVCLTGHWFEWTSEKLKLIGKEETWYATAISWSKENPTAFQGTHETDVLYIFDESSGIWHEIWDAAEGAMTTPGAIWVAFGNPLHNTGRFREIFGKYRAQWETYHIDSRTARHANKAEIEQWARVHGEDSDFFRVKVKGEFPGASDRQFIAEADVRACFDRVIPPHEYSNLPKIGGLDVARGGDDNVLSIRQGYYVSDILINYDIRPSDPEFSMRLSGWVGRLYREYGLDYLFIDCTGGWGWGVHDRLAEIGFKGLIPVVVSHKSDIAGCRHKRDEMWLMTKQAMNRLSLPKKHEQRLVDDFCNILLKDNSVGSFELESKKDLLARGLDSPDVAESICLGFAYPVEAVYTLADEYDFREENYYRDYAALGIDEVTGY